MTGNCTVCKLKYPTDHENIISKQHHENLKSYKNQGKYNINIKGKPGKVK